MSIPTRMRLQTTQHNRKSSHYLPKATTGEKISRDRLPFEFDVLLQLFNIREFFITCSDQVRTPNFGDFGNAVPIWTAAKGAF